MQQISHKINTNDFELTIAAIIIVAIVIGVAATNFYANRTRANPLTIAAIQSIRFRIFQCIILVAFEKWHQKYVITLSTPANWMGKKNENENDPTIAISNILTDCISIRKHYRYLVQRSVYLLHTTNPIGWHTLHRWWCLLHSVCDVVSATAPIRLDRRPLSATHYCWSPFRFHCWLAFHFSPHHYSERFLRALIQSAHQLASPRFARFRQRAIHRWWL